MILLLAALIAAEPMIGKWKLDLSHSKLADQMSIASAGENRYTLTFAGVGDTETLAADGKEHPGVFGTTISVTVEDPNHWKIVRKQNAKVMLTALWHLSDDGRTLTDTFTSFRPDGSPARIDLVYQRAEGASGSGIPGTWESTQEKPDSTYELEIRAFEKSGLTFTSTNGEPPRNVSFDGKEQPTGVFGRRAGDGSIELTTKIKGRVRETRELAVSTDAKTLTLTQHLLDQRVPNVLVFERE